MHIILNEVKDILWECLVQGNDISYLLNILNTYNIEYRDDLLVDYPTLIYGPNSNKYSYPHGIRTFELLNSKKESVMGHVINLYNNKIYYTIIFSLSGNLLIVEEKNNSNIYLRKELIGCISNSKSTTVFNKHKKIAIVEYPKWWQFKRYGNIYVGNNIIKFDILSPRDSVIKSKIPVEDASDLYLIIAGILYRTSKSLTV